MIRIVRIGPDGKEYVPPPRLTVEEVTDPEYNARATARMERFKRNWAWLEAHWADLLPHGWGKFVAVADQQAFLADTAEEAWAWCDRNHPDDSPVVHYLRPTQGPKIYAIYG
jgi:hypothetical protein